MYYPSLWPRDEVVGVIPPPLGITPNFTNPPSKARDLITVHIVFAIISTVFMGLRCYTALFVIRRVRVDDRKPSYYSLKRPLITLVDLLIFAWVRPT